MKELDIPEWAMELRVYMAKTGLNQVKVAKLTGLSLTMIGYYTMGIKRPREDSCEKIWRGIGFDMTRALYLSDLKEREKENGKNQNK